MDFKTAFNNVVKTFGGNIEKTTNSIRSNDFLRFGNRDRMLGEWSQVEITPQDMYRGYSFAVIQKRGNKVASLAKTNLKTWANDEVVNLYQEKNETVIHPYLKLVEDSTLFSEKQFWKNISVYLDLAGRYYLGAVRQPMGKSSRLSPIKEFIMLNPYEIKRVVNSQGELAGYIEHKKDGRYREWPIYQIIEMRELNPFDPDNSQWAIADAAKEAVFTLREGGNYTRESLHGNIDAPGIITTDVILEDEAFANFQARVREHKKGEPLFGNGTGAISWDSMQVDLDKAALLDINNMNREELFAVSGTSKTTLGIEQSGTTRETARVQNENFASDTVQPRLEDIIDFLNLDYKKHYQEEYQKTGYSIYVESAVGADFSTELEATNVRQAQFQLAMSLIQAKYTPESAYQYAEGDINLADLELEEGVEAPIVEESGDGGEEGGDGDVATPETPDVPSSDVEIESDDLEKEVQNDAPKEQGWVGATTESLKIRETLTEGLKAQLYEGDLEPEKSNTPAENNPHFTVVYGLTEVGMQTDLAELCEQYIPKQVKIDSLDVFEQADYDIIVAKLEKTNALEKMHEAFLAQDHYEQEYPEYTPHITLCYVNKTADLDAFKNALRGFENRELKVLGYEIDNPWDTGKNTKASFSDENIVREIAPQNDVHVCCSNSVEDLINEVGEFDKEMIQSAYNALVGEIIGVQHDAIDFAINHVSINNFGLNDIISEEERAGLFARLKNALQKYWIFLIPLLGRRNMQKRNEEFHTNYSFDLNNTIREKVDAETSEVAEGHLNTVLQDILDASNKAYSGIVEDAAADAIIKAYRDNPDRFKDYFKSTPTKKKAISVIRNTDILEKNRKIYERAYDLANQGYDRTKIIKAIQEEFDFVSKERADLIAGNETSRAFGESQYEADYQFLTDTGNLTTAYKELYSRTGDPCEYCAALIAKGPIPFTENFLNKGESITVERNGKVHTFTANYEAISAGTVHPRCHCGYRLILKRNEVNSLMKNGGEGSGNFGHAGRPGEVGGSSSSTTLTVVEQDAVEWYVSGDGQWINQHLRGRMGDNELTEDEEAQLSALDSATDKEVRIDKLYRSVDADAIFGEMSAIDYENLEGQLVFGSKNEDAQSKIDSVIGKTFEEKGFMSTTKSKDVAFEYDQFAELEHPVVLEIDTGGATKGLDIGSAMPELEKRMEQEEVLLHRGIKYVVEDIGKATDDEGATKILIKIKLEK